MSSRSRLHYKLAVVYNQDRIIGVLFRHFTLIYMFWHHYQLQWYIIYKRHICLVSSNDKIPELLSFTIWNILFVYPGLVYMMHSHVGLSVCLFLIITVTPG